MFEAPFRQVWEGHGGSVSRGDGKGGDGRAAEARTTLPGMMVASGKRM